MPRFAELEIHLQRRDEQTCTIGLRFLGPNDDACKIPDAPLGIFSIPRLRPSEADTDAARYGQKLCDALFFTRTDGEALVPTAVERAFADYRKHSPEGLRVRLVVPPDLQRLRWETMRDPDPLRKDAPLFADGSVFLSRYLNSDSWNPARSRRKSSLSALIVVADPAGPRLAKEDGEDGVHRERELAPVDVDGERRRALDALASVRDISTLASDPHSTAPVASLSNILARLRTGVDILYLVCHGSLRNGEPKLWLETEDKDRPYRPVVAGDLIRAIGDLPQVPRLIVLASCQSAGTSTSQDSGILSALGPRLIAEAGVGAVVAMQGNISMETVRVFMPEFFKSMLDEQLGDGQMDRAMTMARGVAKLKGREDYWMPALFTRMLSGAIWHEPGFAFAASDRQQFNWSRLCKAIKDKKCVPLIGPDLAEHLYGSTASIANELAKKAKYPMSAQDAGDLAKVAQFMAFTPQGSQDGTLTDVRDVLEARFEKNASAFLTPGDQPALKAVAQALAQAESDPLRIAASLNAKVYVMAASDSLFEEVLRAVPLEDGTRRDVVPLVMDWRDERRLVRAEAGGRAVYDRTQTEQFVGDPAPEKPCLYYLFGKRDHELSWVLTEDDVVDYLIQTSKYDLIPQVVADAIGSRSLLFLGFPLDDWKFRVLFRMILAIEGNGQLHRFSHVGVQVDPDQSSLADVASAKKYLEDYYRNPSLMRGNQAKPSISIYWGTSADFLSELDQHLKATRAGENH